MSLPTRTPAEGVSPARLALGALLLLSLGAAPALATHYVVAQDGSGDFTTITAALNSYGPAWRETTLVMPGTYQEDIELGRGTPRFLIAVGGTAVTHVRSCRPGDTYDSELVTGFTFEEQVEVLSYITPRLEFRGCVFAKGLRNPASSFLNIQDCDFYGRTDFGGIENYGNTTFTRLRFHSAPLRMWLSNGDIWMTDCVFEGPADTLLYIDGSDCFDPLYLVGATFENAKYGIVTESPYGITMAGCTFAGICSTAIHHRASRGYPQTEDGTAILGASFTDCGTAIRWEPWIGPWWSSSNPWLYLGCCESRRCARTAVVAGTMTRIMIECCRFEEGGGDGVEIALDDTAWGDYGLGPTTVFVVQCRFAGNSGSGMVVEGTPSPRLEPFFIRGNTFVGNGSAGLDLGRGFGTVDKCVFLANGGDGFVCSPAGDEGPLVISNCTSARNMGDGLRIDAGTIAPDSLLDVHHNLSALNARAGFRMPHASTGSFACNDSWGNYLAPYVGAWGSADSNLTVDPRFCDLAGGALGLMQGSPCGAGGVYGLIGALPESCPDLVAVEPISAPGVAFSVRPSVARGSVEFVVPAGAGEARVEVYDVGGRTVWRTTVGAAGGAVRWQGEGAGGRARAGLYWARCTRGSDAATRRLVWLE